MGAGGSVPAPLPGSMEEALKTFSQEEVDAFLASRQSAFVFVKPHANTEAVQALVKDKFAKVGIRIASEGTIDGPTIDAKLYIDQHYYAIASKATIMKPPELNVPVEKFEAQFGETWETVLKEQRVLNALDACKKLGCDADALDVAWAAAKKAKKLVKFGGGFYCGYVPFLRVSSFFFLRTKDAPARSPWATSPSTR